MRRPDGQTLFLASVVVGSVLLFGYLFFYNDGHAGNLRPRTSFDDMTTNSDRCYQYLKNVCALGPRISGTDGMRRQQQLLEEHFTKLGGRVSYQQFDVRHPQQGTRVTMANMIVEWNPESRERIVLCCHYDTRPYPDQDRRRPRGTFIGANDGGSGVAVLMELGHHMARLPCRYGVDFVFFDGEELVYDGDRDKYFWGSEHFAKQYVAQPPLQRYRWGVLMDMVGDAELQIFQERNSYRWTDTRPLVDDIWNTAKRLGVDDFIPRTRHDIRDDHLALHDIARIPTCDIIDFDYPRPGAASYWHTEADLPDKCSGLSLAKVGWVLLEWLKRVK